jgi:hypothetical protein
MNTAQFSEVSELLPLSTFEDVCFYVQKLLHMEINCSHNNNNNSSSSCCCCLVVVVVVVVTSIATEGDIVAHLRNKFYEFYEPQRIITIVTRSLN